MTETELLINTLDYYLGDTNRRCTDNHSQGCYYDPINADKAEISEGCAIGRWMTKRQKRKADKIEDGGVCNLPDELIPLKLRKFKIELLSSIQFLHDATPNWKINSLTSSGKSQVEDIIHEYKLDKNQFTKGVHY